MSFFVIRDDIDTFDIDLQISGSVGKMENPKHNSPDQYSDWSWVWELIIDPTCNPEEPNLPFLPGKLE